MTNLDMNRASEITFLDLCQSTFGDFTKVVYNGKTIYSDTDEGLYLDGKLIKREFNDSWQIFKEKHGKKYIYNFYCRIVDFHHTEVYIEGD